MKVSAIKGVIMHQVIFYCFIHIPALCSLNFNQKSGMINIEVLSISLNYITHGARGGAVG
jgi:hypothetical protein